MNGKINKPTYSLEDLAVKGDTEEEGKRQLLIYETIKERDEKNLYIAEYEKYFTWLLVRSANSKGHNFELLKCFDHPEFKFLYFTYLFDFTGNSKYRKPIGIGYYNVLEDEVKADLNLLFKTADEWEHVINKTNHKEQLLYQAAVEAREEIRNLNKQPGIINDKHLGEKSSYVFKVRKILLHSKFLYCMALEIIETSTIHDFRFTLNEEVIEFNEFSLIHILNRHFAQTAKQYNTDKSFHTQNMKPRILGSQLKNIIEAIDLSKILQGKSIDKIAFKLNGLTYLIYTKLKIDGKRKYRRLETFYILHDAEILKQLIENSQLKKVDEKLEVYLFA